MSAELLKEYNRLGRPLAGDEWLESDIVIPLAKKWMVLNASKDADGKIVMPARVKHPGKAWLMTQAAEMSSASTETSPPLPAERSQPDKAPAPEVPPSAKDSTGDFDYKVLYRDGGQRLVQLNFLGKRTGDVPLPANSNFKIVVHDGKQVLSGKGGLELYDCREYVEALMPASHSGPSGEATASGQGQLFKITNAFVENIRWIGHQWGHPVS